MFDTNVFNRLLDGVVPLSALSGRVTAHATHIQRDEISNTTDPDRRRELLQIFGELLDSTTPTSSLLVGVSRVGEARVGGGRFLPTHSAVWGVSSWDNATWSSDASLYERIKADLDALNKGKKNNPQDALIAETSIVEGHILITDDGDLATVTEKYNGKCLTVLSLWQQLQ